MRELISIIIPVYNAEAYLNPCLNSIVNQTYSEIEIILIDDGSTDKSGEICDSYSLVNSKVRVIHMANQGVSAARNIGIKQAKGKYIAFVDSDDWVEPNFIECLIYNMKKSNADLSIVDLVYEYSNEDEGQSTNISRLDVKEISSDGIWFELLYSSKIGGFLCNKLFKKQFITRLLDESLHYCEDFVFTAEYCKNIEKAVCTDAKLYHYRQGQGNASSNFTYNSKIFTLLNSYQKIEEIYAEFAPEELDNVKKNTLKIALNLRARYKLNKVIDISSYQVIQSIICDRIKTVILSKKVSSQQKINILLTWMFPTILFRVKSTILGRKI